MKLRFDFVSNSSSSSFILRGKYAAKGIRLLKRVAETYEIPYRAETEISLHVYALNKNIAELRKMLDENYEKDDICRAYSGYTENSSPDELCWDYVEIPLSECSLEKLNDAAFEKTEKIEFYMGDTSDFMIMLKMLYLFFQKNGCCPDTFDSEQDFITSSCIEKFMYALTRNFGHDAKKGEIR